MNKEDYLQGFNDYKKGVFEMIEEYLMEELQDSYAIDKEYYEQDLDEDEKEDWDDYSDWWSEGIKNKTVTTYLTHRYNRLTERWWNLWEDDEFFQQVLEMKVGLDPKIVWDEVNQLVFDCIWEVAGYGNLWGHNNFMNWNINEPWEVKQ